MSEIVRGVNLFSASYHPLPERSDEALRIDAPMRVRLELLPWRREGGSVVATPLVLECDVPNKKTAHEDIGTRFVSLVGTLSVRCRIEEETDEGARGTLLEITPGLYKDRALSGAANAVKRAWQRAEERKKARLARGTAALEVASWPLGGSVILDAEDGRLKGERRAVEIVIDRTERSAEEDVRSAEAVVAALEPRLPRLALGVAARLLDVYNAEWRPVKAPPHSLATFATMIQLERVEITRGETVTLWYQDDDMLSGHRIRARVGQGGVEAAEIVGRRPGLIAASEWLHGAIVDRFVGRGDDGKRALHCRLTPWRRGEGEMQTKPLFVVRAIEDRKAAKEDPELQTLTKHANVTLRGRITENTPDVARANLLSVEEPSADPELTAAVEASRSAVEMVSPTLGEIRLNASTEQLVGNRGHIEVRIERSDRSVTEDVAGAEAAVTMLEPRLGALARGVAERLITLYNEEDWRAADAPLETIESFVERIELESINVGTNGDIELWYSDDDLFAGHHILARVGPDGVEDADLFG